MDWSAVALAFTAIGVLIAAFELRASGKIAQSEFEDSIDQQYRELARGIPVDALLGKEVREDQKDNTRELIYNYLDLCNEQVFLRKKKRITKDTWTDWSSGMKSNLKKPEFVVVWEEVKTALPETFSFLERLEQSNFQDDPAKWRL